MDNAELVKDGTISGYPCDDWDEHTFLEVYYGHCCTKCGLFYAFGCAPWEDDEVGELIEEGGESGISF